MHRLLVLVVLLPASLARSDEPLQIRYSMPSGERPHADAEYSFSQWSVGTTLCRVEDGAPFVVKGVGARARLDGRVDQQYEGTGGSGGAQETVFGGQLTPLCFVADLDGDTRATEHVQVFFTRDFKIRVQAPGGMLDIEPRGGAYLASVGGPASAQLVDAKVAGIALLKVGSHPEACSDYGDYYVSFDKGVPKLALSVEGLADPPTHVTPTLRFDPRAGTATVTMKYDNEGEKPRKKVLRYKRVNGVYEAIKP